MANPPTPRKPTISAELLAALNLPGSVQIVTEQGLVSAADLKKGAAPPPPPRYSPDRALPTDRLAILLQFRSVNPLYGAFLLEHLGLADFQERLQILESCLETPPTLGPQIRVPQPADLPFGPLAVERLHPRLIELGLLTLEQLDPQQNEDESPDLYNERPRWAVPLGDKLRMLFEAEHPAVHDIRIQSVWIAGRLLLDYAGDFQKYVGSCDLIKQEGLVFRHLLRLILLAGEFAQMTPVGVTPTEWEHDMRTLADRLTESCRAIDPESTDDVLASQQSVDPLSAT